MGVMDDPAVWESSDHKWDSYQKHYIKAVTKLSVCYINENRIKLVTRFLIQFRFIRGLGARQG
jgi:hypothetical protein